MKLPKTITSTPLQEDEIEYLHDFYTAQLKDGILDLRLDRLKIIEKIKLLNFYRYDIGVSSIFVSAKKTRIELTSEQMIIDAFEDYLLALPDRVVSLSDGRNEKEFTITGKYIQSVMYRSLMTYFGANLGRLRPVETITFVKENANTKYFFFENTVVEIKPDKINYLDYKDLQGYIWNSSVIDRDFTYTDTEGIFETFVNDITDNKENRKKSLMSMLGYLMHDFYECDLRAVLLTDVNINETGEAAGGTGKGLLGKALDQVLNRSRNDTRYVSVPCKNRDFSKDTRYSGANISTTLLHLEDTDKRMKLDDIYNDVTDGATIRKNYSDPIVKLLKIMVSINHTIDLKSASDRRRVVVFELANYYSDKFRPEAKFGKRFFESAFTTDDWNQFYSFMVRCAQTYLSCGLIEAQELNYSNRTLLESLPEDFVYWFSEQLSKYTENRLEHEFVKKTLFLSFTEKYSDYDNIKFKQKHFSEYCQKYCRLKNIPYCTYRSTDDVLVIYPSAVVYGKAKQQSLNF